MTTPSWPDDLPIYVDGDSYRYTSDYGVLRTETDSGAVKTRRRFDTVRTVRTVVLWMEERHRAAWETFVAEIAGGALPFTWPVPDRDGTETVRLVVPESGLELRQASRSPGDTTWTVDLTVEVLS